MGIRKHLITYSKRAHMTILGERPDGLLGTLSPKMDHLVCFMPGTIALGATGGLPLSEAKKSPKWTRQQDEEMLLAQELMKTCWATYKITKTGLAPEITYFQLDNPPKMMTDMYPPDNKQPPQPVSKPLDASDESGWKADIDIHRQDRHNLQRPETAESLFYMYRITGDETYRQWGWDMFKSFVEHTAVVEHDSYFHSSHDEASGGESAAGTHSKDHHTKDHDQGHIVGFTSLSNADTVPPVRRDNMESFWMAETLKYFYLLFSEREFISLEEHVFNTEAHPMPRFQPSGELRTGWVRQSR